MIRDEAYNLIDRLDNDVLTDVLNYALRINPSIFAAVVAQNMSNIIPFFTEDDKQDMEFLAKRFLSNSRKPIKSGNEQVNKNLTEEDINKAADYFGITYDEAKGVLSIPNYDVEWDDIPFVVNTVNEFMNGDFSNIESVSYVDEDDWIPILKKPEVEDMFQFRFEGTTKYTMRDGSERYIGFGGEDDIDVTDYYLKALSENKINSSKNPIKSSLEDRLIPYLEEFEEGYADALTSTDEMGNNARLETFYEIFKSDYNLSDNDINKLEGAVQDIWHETEEDTEHDMGEMYGAPHGATPEEALKHFE